MDKQLIETLKHLPLLQNGISRMEIATKGAKESFQSAVRLQRDGYEGLCAKRMKRCEALLTQLRKELAKCLEIEDTIMTIINTSRVADGKQTHGSWNKLPDHWWEERMNQIKDEMIGIQLTLIKIQTQLDSHSGTYAEVVLAVHEQVIVTVSKMQHLSNYVEQWQQLARIVADGVGESLSFVTRDI